MPARDEYIVSTSEFDAVKKRLQMIESNQKVNNANPNKPALRKRTDQNSSASTDSTSDDDDRPTLKRRPDDQQP